MKDHSQIPQIQDKAWTTRETKKYLKGYPQTTTTKKTPDWKYVKNSDKWNLEKDVDGNINGPWPEVIEVYMEITQEGTPECHECEMEMMVGDIALLCPNCNEKYHVGGKGERLTCVRPDIEMGKIETVDVPDAYLKKRHNVWQEKTKKKLTIPNGTFKITNPDDGGTEGSIFDVSETELTFDGKSLTLRNEED